MPEATPMAVACHEAGHAVAAHVLGHPIRSATLALVWTRPRDARAAVLIALAGPAAEIVHAGHAAPERERLWSTAWATDRRNALRALDGVDGADLDFALRRATKLVCEHWDWVIRLARVLRETGELSGDQINALIGARE